MRSADRIGGDISRLSRFSRSLRAEEFSSHSRDARLLAAEVKTTSSGTREHWANFIECFHTRRGPPVISRNAFVRTATCLLGNIAIRSKMRLAWDFGQMTTVQDEGRQWMSRPEHAPWKIVV